MFIKVCAAKPGPYDQKDVADFLGDCAEDVPGRQADAGDDSGVWRLQEGPAASQWVHQRVHS